MEIGPRHLGLSLLVHRYGTDHPIDRADAEALLGLEGVPLVLSAQRTLVNRGDTVQAVHLVIDGLLARSRELEDGRRQIVSMHIPGDLVDLRALVEAQAMATIEAVTASTVLKIPLKALRRLANASPRMSHILWRDAMAAAALAEDRLVAVGCMDAQGRLAGLIWEMAHRYDRIGALRGDTFTLPMTQAQIADTLGITSVHTNRCVKSLRDDGAVHIARTQVTILDWDALAFLASVETPAPDAFPPAIRTVAH